MLPMDVLQKYSNSNQQILVIDYPQYWIKCYNNSYQLELPAY